jgi:hypothetical protein
MGFDRRNTVSDGLSYTRPNWELGNEHGLVRVIEIGFRAVLDGPVGGVETMVPRAVSTVDQVGRGVVQPFLIAGRLPVVARQ